MKTRLILITGLVLSATLAFAQSDGVKEEGAHQAEYNANSEVRDHSPEIDSRDSTTNTVDAGEQDNFGGTTENTIISPPGTRTTSPSGSPGVRMEDPSNPDGTNTMQQAKPNIAGSPVPGASAANPEHKNVPANKSFRGEEQQKIPLDDAKSNDQSNDRVDNGDERRDAKADKKERRRKKKND